MPEMERLGAVAVRRREPLGSYFARTWQLYALMVPGMALVIIFLYGPLYGVTIAFKDYYPSRGILGSPWVGLRYFEFMFMLPDTGRVFRNTLVIAVLKIVIGFPVPILISLLLNEVSSSKFKRSVQTIVYLPHFLSWVILAGIMIDMLSIEGGLVNRVIGAFGVEPVFFLGNNDYFRGVLVSSDIWKNFGFATVIYMAALTGIDPQLYEAALIDGANRWTQTLHVTIPGILPIVVLTAVLQLGNVLNANFDQVFNLYNPMVYETADIVDTYVYRLALQRFDFSLGTAVGLIKSAVSFILISSGYWLAYKLVDYRIF